MSHTAAAGLVFAFGDDSPVFALRKTGETDNTETFAWNPVPGAVGYRFMSASMTRPSHTWDPGRTSVRFSKAGWYRVEALAVSGVAHYPPEG